MNQSSDSISIYYRKVSLNIFVKILLFCRKWKSGKPYRMLREARHNLLEIVGTFETAWARISTWRRSSITFFSYKILKFEYRLQLERRTL